LAQNYLQLALCRVGVGMGEGGCIPTGHSLLSANFTPRQRGRAMAVLTAGTPVAAFFSPLIGGLAAQQWGWRAAFLILGVPGLILAVLIILTVREPRVANPETSAKPKRFLADARWLFSSPSFVLLFIATALTGLAIGSTNVFTGSFFIRQFGMSLRQAGLVMAVGIGLAGVAGNFLGGYLADRFAGERGRSYVLVPALGMGLAGALFLVTFSRDSWPAAVGFLFAANIAGDMRTSPVYAAVQNLAPAHMRATAAAVAMLAMTGIGTAFGPVIVGLISDASASGAFPADFGDFGELCPGGKAAKGATADLASACARASASGLRSAMLLVPLLYGGAMAFFYASSRSFRISFAEA
jgi:predicted MFS family arabinose efflux permease